MKGKPLLLSPFSYQAQSYIIHLLVQPNFTTKMADNAMNTELRQKLITGCKEAKEMSYSPYSKFRVGAALLTKDNHIFKGCNVENASYGVTICAEQVALTKAVSEGHLEFKAIAITCDNKDKFLAPCGTCRQVMSEFGDMQVYLVKENEWKKSSVKELLPLTFGKEDLDEDRSSNLHEEGKEEV